MNPIIDGKAYDWPVGFNMGMNLAEHSRWRWSARFSAYGTFRFIAPAEAARLNMPDSCTSCHTDKTAAWATDALKTWKEFSVRRVAN